MRREDTTPTPPEGDAKANEPAITEGVALSTLFACVVIFRSQDQADLPAAMRRVKREQRIRNAVIVSNISRFDDKSLRRAAGGAP